MKTLKIQGTTGVSNIRIGERLQHLKNYVDAEKAIIVTDTNVKHYYQKKFPPYDVITVETGEKTKNLDTVRNIYRKLVELEADRSTLLIGIGGGIVCDITGFVASTFLRGMRFGFVSSTLLSQVDASVGGKNGVNFEGYKNMIGVFEQPQFVICDLDLLKTLPEKEILCGLAEIIKHAAIQDAELFTYIETHAEKILSLDTEVMEKLVHNSVAIKARIVNRDEKEKGERRKLNFGHTFGHALEKTTGVSHGEAVSAGMMLAAEISEKKGGLPADDANRLKKMLQRFNLPTKLPADRTTILEALRKDKKRAGDHIFFVLLSAIGNAFVEKIAVKDFEALISDLD